jgi:hypothetical protein
VETSSSGGKNSNGGINRGDREDIGGEHGYSGDRNGGDRGKTKYQNHHNTCQTDGGMILYFLKQRVKRKQNQE